MDLLSYVNIYVLLGCVLLGYIVKQWTTLEWVNNKLIPTILMIVGGIAYWFIYQDINMVVVGGFVGIGATGCYEMVSNWINLLKSKYGKSEVE